MCSISKLYHLNVELFYTEIPPDAGPEDSEDESRDDPDKRTSSK